MLSLFSRTKVNRALLLSALLSAAACSDSSSPTDNDGNNGSNGGGGTTGTLLTSGVPVTNISGAEDSEKLYRISVPSTATNLTVTTTGGSGDVDMYLRAGAAPTPDAVDCFSESDGNAESCIQDGPTSGTWYVLLYGYTAYSGVTLTATAGTGTGGGGGPTAGQIYFRVQQDLSYPAGSGAIWCDLVSSNYTDDNPAVPDVPSAHMTTYAGPSSAGTFNATYTFSGSTVVNFSYTLAAPAPGYRRNYTQMLRRYSASLNRCIDVSKEVGSLSYVDVAL